MKLPAGTPARVALNWPSDSTTRPTKTLSDIAANPHIGWRCRLRHLSLRSTRVFLIEAPFEKILIFYRIASNGVDVVRVLHGSQGLEQLFDREGAE